LARLKFWLLAAMTLGLSVLYGLFRNAQRLREKDKRKNAEAVIQAEHESNALLQDRLGEEKRR